MPHSPLIRLRERSIPVLALAIAYQRVTGAAPSAPKRPARQMPLFSPQKLQ